MENYRKKECTDIHSYYWYFGGIAGAVATILTHPVDLVRSHVQGELKPTPSSEVIRLIIKYNGYYGLYYGLYSSMSRQLWFSAQRFGIYEAAVHHGLAVNYWQKAGVAAVAGLIAGFTNAPLEKVGIQMRMDAARPPETRRNYQGYMDGFRRLYKEGGAKNIFTGGALSAIRGMLLNVGQLLLYHQITDNFHSTHNNNHSNHNNHKHVESWETFFFASLVAGGITGVIILPLDVINTIGKNAEFKQFRDSWHIAQSICRENGFKGLYKGCTLSIIRFVPQTIFTFMFYEELLDHFGD